jgi:hypothetical protein
MARCEGCCTACWDQESSAARFASYLRPVVPLGGWELEQMQFLLGHASVQTTERYLGCKQKFRHAVNSSLGLIPRN